MFRPRLSGLLADFPRRRHGWQQRKSPKLLLHLVLLSTTLVAVNGCAVTGPWRLAKQRQGIELYLQEYPDSAIPEFKGVVTINTSLQNVMSMLTDFSSWPDWVYGCRHAEVVRTLGYSEAYLYQITDMPLISDRDALLHGVTKVDESGNEIVIHVEAAPRYCDNNDISGCRLPNESRLVRVTQLNGSFHLKKLGPDKVLVTWRQHVEPGGGVPDWITRFMLSKVPMRSLQKLKQRLER